MAEEAAAPKKSRAKKAPPDPAIAAEVVAAHAAVALKPLLNAETEMRLVQSGKTEAGAGLFPNVKALANRDAIQFCRNNNYIEPVREEAVKTGKTTSTHTFVKLTPAGREFVMARVPPGEMAELIESKMGRVRERMQVALDAYAQQSAAIAHQVQTVRELVSKFLTQQSQLQRQLSAEHETMQHQIEGLKGELDKYKPPESKAPKVPPAPPSPPREPLPTPTGDEATVYRVNVGRELAHAWDNTDDPTGRERFAGVLYNMGAVPIGSPGERVNFTARLHDGDVPDLFPGDPVEVAKPGWMFRQGDAETLLLKAAVRAAEGDHNPE